MKKLKTTIIILCLLISININSDATTSHKTLSCALLQQFYIKRLVRSAYCLSLLHKKKYHYTPCNIAIHNEYIQIDSISFFHHKITLCINTMLYSTSVKPLLLLLLQEIKDYRYNHDQQFLRELCLLIFTVNKQILLHECEATQHSLKTITLNDIIIISEKINQLPVAEILNAIDMLVTELPPFLEKYEFHSKITWKVWLRKYWWVPPVFGAWFGLKILLRLQKHNFYYSPYNVPKPPINLPLIITTDPALLEIRDST